MLKYYLVILSITMETVSVKFENDFLKDIKKTMKGHRYSTTTEFIREAVRDKLTDLVDEEEFNGLLEKHPEWKDWKFQMERMADMVAERYALYDGNMKQVVTHHNSPVAAKRGVDTAAGYYSKVVKMSSRLASL